MSLAVTEVSKFGVVMAADTAETVETIGPSGRKYVRTKVGTQKLYPFVTLRGGVSYWGAGELFIDVAGGSGRVPTNVWLEDFIAINQNLNSLEQVAYTIASNMRGLLGTEAPSLGFQISGITGVGETLAAVFYRVSNFDHKGGRRPEFEVERVDTFPHLQDQEEVFVDGDGAVFSQLVDAVRQVGPLKSSLGHPIPEESLRGRSEYTAARVRFVSQLYQSAALEQTIGGAVTTVRIGYNGKVETQTA